MPITNAFWSPKTDIHLLPGQGVPNLLGRLALGHSTLPNLVFANDPSIAPLITTNFVGGFAGAPNNFGVTVTPATGQIAVANPLPGGNRLRNFLVRAEVSEGGSVFAIKPLLRVHVHSAVTRVWLTPSTLTIHAVSGGTPIGDIFQPKLTVLAQFDDGVIGNITDLPGLSWSTSDAGQITVDGINGLLLAINPNRQAQITVTLPAALGGGSATATVRSVPAWGAPGNLTFIGGKGAAQWNNVPNILFVSEGFAAAEQAQFEAYVTKVVQKLHTWNVTRPYDLLRSSVNYWYAFSPSPEADISVRSEVVLTGTGAQRNAVEMPDPMPPTGAEAQWTPQQLMHEVGLPIPADSGAALNTKLAEWQAVYGPHVTEAKARNAFDAWKALASRAILNERDTNLGLAFGVPPCADYDGITRVPTLHDRRVGQRQLELLVGALTHSGVNIGQTWIGAGKDAGLICIVAKSNQRGGGNVGRPGALGSVYFNTTIHDTPFCIVRANAGGNGFDIVPCAIPGNPANDTVATVAHESAHSFHLLDEYGETGDVSHLNFAGPATRYDNEYNVQNRDQLLTGGQLDAAKIKWLWPRLSAAGVLTGQPTPAGGNFQVTLQAGHTTPFRERDVVRLRRRPLPANPAPSGRFRITAINAGANTITLEPLAGTAITPANFPAGSLLIRPVRRADSGATLGDDLPLVAPIIFNHINATHAPLNRPSDNLLGACALDDSVQQAARNLPSGLPKCRPRRRGKIVGLYEGGDQFHCGVYHPTGMCIMRSYNDREEAGQLVPFCPVCRYALVDIIDPTQHGTIDSDYARDYPQP
ncbi:MAG: hypothetical protein IT323_03240 [Anaerolineae bacterium]|nr:hypothetical protein [Anaerolineae bacterium]